MVTRDPEKNRQYVAKHRAMKKANEETKKEYNQLNLSCINKFNEKLKEKKGREEYNKDKAEYMRMYRANKKAHMKDLQTNKSIIDIQNAFRNKLARNALNREKEKQANKTTIKAVTKIIEEKNIDDLFKNVLETYEI